MVELKPHVASMTEAHAELARAFAPLREMAERLAVTLRLLYFQPPGYYVQNGKLRRDHSYFRQRARDRRAAAKRARSASSR